jgi:hypothetical protein
MRRLRMLFRRTICAFHRSFWDAADVVGDHALFAALSAVSLGVLALVFVSRGDALSALWGLGAVWLVFLIFVLLKFGEAWRHPDRHRHWEWLDYGMPPDLWRVDIQSLGPLRPRSRHYPVKPLLCRVVAPDGSRWESSDFSHTFAAGDAYMRWYPQDFRSPKSGQPPPGIFAGEYEVTWLEPKWGLLKRPLLRYTQTAARD